MRAHRNIHTCARAPSGDVKLKERKGEEEKKTRKKNKKKKKRLAIKLKQFFDIYIRNRNNEWMRERERGADWQAERQSERETK